MRRVLSISLIALLFLNLFGFYAAFILKQQMLRSEMNPSLDEGQSGSRDVFVLTKAQYQQIKWRVAGKEFRMDGRLYDVAKIEVEGDRFSIYIEDDEKETQLVDNFTTGAHEQAGREASNSPIQVLLQHFLVEYLNASNCCNYLLCFTPLSKMHYKYLGYHSFISDYQSPPPKLV